MISTVIVTLNETEKLVKCLESIKNFSDEIIIIDLGSRAGLENIVKKYKVSVFQHKKVTYVELIRNFAISKARGEWVLTVDPDEQLPSGLKDELIKIAKEDNYTAVNIPRKNIFFNQWIKHTNFWPDRQIRFFKKGYVEWTTIIHSYPKVKGALLNLPASEELAILHYGYDSYIQFIRRQIRYSSVEAENRYKNGARFSFINLIWLPLREFLVRFVKHGGFLDGLNGFFLVFILMFFKIITELKLLALENKGSRR